MYMQSAQTYGKARIIFGIKAMIMEKESNVYYGVDNSILRKRKDYPSLLAIPITYGLTDEIDMNLSVYGFHDTRTLVSKEDVRLGYGEPVQGIGSTRFGVKIRLPLRKKSRIQVAGKFSAMLDTSKEEADGLNYRWSRTGTDIKASLYESFDIFPNLSLNLEQGYVLSGSNIYDDQVIGGIGLQFTAKNRFVMNLEVNSRTFLGVGPQSVYKAGDNPDKFETVNGIPAIGNPLYLKDTNADIMDDFLLFSPSIALRLTQHLSANIGVNINLADHIEPKENYQFVAGLTFNGIFSALIDTDDDGIRDNRDREINTPHGFPVDTNGIALDTDFDGVPDGKDMELDTPLGAKTTSLGVGIDSDNDGVYDGIDMEPNTPEGSPVNKFGVALDDDRDGVPNIHDLEADTPAGAVVDKSGRALDTDGDTVPDGIDIEPDTPNGAKVDSSGAAIDTDEDGVPDGIDEEPDTPYGTLVDKHGRGLIKHEVSFLSEGLLRVTDIQFEPGSSVIQPESYHAIDEIGQLLIKYPSIQIQIEGHTDALGDNRLNLKLSRERAIAVREYLLKTFSEIDNKRLRAVGFGSDRPIAPNSTFNGRQANRRVEFVIINHDKMIKQ